MMGGGVGLSHVFPVFSEFSGLGGPARDVGVAGCQQLLDSRSTCFALSFLILDAASGSVRAWLLAGLSYDLHNSSFSHVALKGC